MTRPPPAAPAPPVIPAPAAASGARRRLAIGLALLALLVVASLLDRPAYLALRVADRAATEGRDWYQMLRAAGYLPVWLLIAAAFLLHDTGRRAPAPGSAAPARAPWRRAAYLATAPALAGLAAEILKPLIGRERPTHHEGFYHFKPFLQGFVDGSNLGLPSSHAAVAFGGAFALAFIMPRTAPVALLAAAGCGLTRLLSGAHFLSDVCAGALVAYAVAAALRPLLFGAPQGGPRP